jgi:sec-independent protein translocase protein TatA
MGMSFGHLALLLIVVLVVFGAGKLPSVMGDLAKGIRAFKDGMRDDADKELTKIDHKNDSDKAA